MNYPFVVAKYFTAGAMTQPRAVVIHMAEGGGTVLWLTHPTNNNSSHFVVEYSGRVVQMVRDTDASHSLHVDRPYGQPGTGDYGIYSLDTAKAVLGTGIANPNAYIFAVEVEGFAASGPNDAQTASLKALIADLRKRYPSIAGNLGHRDFQNYKPCPGGRISWLVLGGHGRYAASPTPASEEDMALTLTAGNWTPTKNPTTGASNGVLRTGPDRSFPFPVRLPLGTIVTAVGNIDNTWLVTRLNGVTYFMLGSDWLVVPDANLERKFDEFLSRLPGDDGLTPFTQDDIDAAVLAQVTADNKLRLADLGKQAAAYEADLVTERAEALVDLADAVRAAELRGTQALAGAVEAEQRRIATSLGLTYLTGDPA